MRVILYIGTVTTALFAVAAAAFCPLTFEYSKKFNQCVRPTSEATCKSFKDSYHSGEICFVSPNNRYPSAVSFCQEPFQQCDNDLGHCCSSVSLNECARYEAYFANGMCIVPVGYDKGVKNVCPEGFGWTPKIGYCTRLLRLTKYCSTYPDFKIIDAKCCVPAKNVTLTTPPEKDCPKNFEDVDGVCEGTLRNKRCVGGVQVGGKCYSSSNPRRGSESETETTALQTTVEPTEATMEPTEATMEPTEATMEPTEATMEPTEATMEPTEATRKPTKATRKPIKATTKPPKDPESGSESHESQEDSNSHNQCPLGFLTTKHGCFGLYNDNCANHNGINQGDLCVITFPTCPQNFEANNGQCVGELDENECEDAKGLFSSIQKLCVVEPQGGHPDCPPAFVRDAGLCIACSLSNNQCQNHDGTYDSGYCYVVPHSKTHECPAKSTLIHGLCASVETTKCECDAVNGQYDQTTSSCLFDAKKIVIQEAECQSGFDFDPELKLCRKDVDNSECDRVKGDYIGGACFVEPNKPSSLCHEDFLYDRAEKVCKSTDASRILCRHLRGKYKNVICIAAVNHTDSDGSQRGSTKKPVAVLYCPQGTVLSSKDGKCHGKLNLIKCNLLGGKFVSGLCVVDAKKSLYPTTKPAPEDVATTAEDLSYVSICPPGTVLSRKTEKCYGRLNNDKCSRIGGKLIARLCVAEPKKVSRQLPTTTESYVTTPEGTSTTDDGMFIQICPEGTALSINTGNCHGRLNLYQCSLIGGKLISGMCIVVPGRKGGDPTAEPDELPTTTKGFVHKVYCPEGTVLSKADDKCHGRMGFGKCKQLGGKIIAGICIVEPIKKQETTTEPPTSDEVPTTTKGFVHKVYCPEGTVLSKADEQCHGKMSFAKCRQLGGKRINRICVVEPRTKTSGATKEPGTSDEAPPTTKGFIHEVFCPEGTVLSKVDNKCHGRMGFSKCKQLGGKIIAGVCIIEPIEKQETTTEPPTSDEVPSTTESFEQQLFCPEGTVLSKVDGKCHGKISFAKCRQLSGKRINRICVVEPRTKIGSATKKPGTSDEVHPTAESFAQKVFCPEGTVLSKVDGKCHGKMNFSKCRQLGGKRIAGVCIVAAKKPTTPFAPTAEPSELSTEPKDPQTTTEEFDNFTYCPKGTVLSKKTGKCYGKMGPSKCNLLGGKIIAGFCIVLPKLVNPITTEEPKPTTEEPEATTEYILPPTTREPRKPLVIFPAAFNSNATFYTKEPKIIICRSDAPANTRTERCEKSTTAAQCAKLKGVYYDKLGLCSIPPHVQRVPLCYGDLDYYSGIHFCGLDYSEDECNNRGYAFYKNRCIYAPIKKLLSCPAGSSLSKVQGEQQLNKCIHKLARKKCEKNGFKYENRQCFSYAEPCPAGYSYHNGYESCKKPNANKASCKHDKGVLYSGACFVPPLVE